MNGKQINNSTEMLEAKTITIQGEILEEIKDVLERVESVLATLELLSDKEAMEGITEGLEDIKSGRTVRLSADEIKELLE
jgi:hypothetical protein